MLGSGGGGGATCSADCKRARRRCADRMDEDCGVAIDLILQRREVEGRRGRWDIGFLGLRAAAQNATRAPQTKCPPTAFTHIPGCDISRQQNPPHKSRLPCGRYRSHPQPVAVPQPGRSGIKHPYRLDRRCVHGHRQPAGSKRVKGGLKLAQTIVDTVSEEARHPGRPLEPGLQQPILARRQERSGAPESARGHPSRKGRGTHRTVCNRRSAQAGRHRRSRRRAVLVLEGRRRRWLGHHESVGGGASATATPERLRLRWVRHLDAPGRVPARNPGIPRIFEPFAAAAVGQPVILLDLPAGSRGGRRPATRPAAERALSRFDRRFGGLVARFCRPPSS